MALTDYEQQVRNVLENVTGYSFTKNYDGDEETYYYELTDNYGDVDGDPFFEFDDLVDYICNNEQVNMEITAMEVYA